MSVTARAGIWLATGGIVVAVAGVFLATPPLNFGIWNQAEPVLVAIHFGAAMAALGLAAVLVRCSALRRGVLHPFVLVPAALAIWSFAVSFFQPSPARTLYGSPELGEGVLLYLEIAVLTAAAITVKRWRAPRLTIVIAATAVTIAISLATAIYFHVTPIPLVPYFFADYLAFYGIFLVAILLGFARIRTRWMLTATFVAGLVIVLISNNNAGIVFAIIAAPIGWFILTKVRLSVAGTRTLAALAIAGTAISATVVVKAVDFVDLARGSGTVARLANSVVSRHHLLNIVADAVRAEPALLARGNGWGTFSDLLSAYLPVNWVRLRDDPEANEILGSQGVWDAVQRVDFHSHNFLADAFVAAGLIGALLALAIPVILPIWCGRRNVALAGAFGVAFAGLSAFWFQVPASMPVMALAWGGLAGAPPKWGRHRVWRNAAFIALVGLGVLFVERGYAALQFSRYAYYFTPAMSAPLLNDDGSRAECAATFDDGHRGGLHLAHRLRTFASFAVRRVDADRGLDDEMVRRLRGLICAAEDYVDHDEASLRLKIAALSARADLAFATADPAIAPLVRAFLANWETRLNDVLDTAPRRTDLAAPYLLMLLRDGRDAQFRAYADRIYRRNPNDPIALWFSGIARLGDAATAALGIARMRRALAGGLERLIPVDQRLKAEVLGETTGAR